METDSQPGCDAPPDAAAQAAAAKLKGVRGGGGSAARKYFALTYGPMPRWKALLMELVAFFLSGMPGAPGLFLRSKLYRPFFGACGRKVVIGRHVTLRHPSKIRLGDGVVVDDNAVLDAKGDGNRGLSIGAGAYIGRNTIVYCKGGDIEIGEGASLSANCIVFSSNRLSLGAGTMVGSFSYLLSGGEYDWRSPVPFAQQSGMVTKGPLEIGENCWIGAHVTVLDAASIGPNTTVGAGAVVSRPLPGGVLALGAPARPVRERPLAPETPGA